MSLGAAVVFGLLTSVLFAPSAFAMVVHPFPSGPTSPAPSPTAPSVAHNVVVGGMAGWQISLIAVGAALAAAALALLADRVRYARHGVTAGRLGAAI
jgi:hypothetical protein